ncbi:hypothetical protein LX64_02644 [Chitinophaga skermanii]|uniref:Uncharacterized protein n=2 Tax=Chitinophaga skermanii TaxID=331697 RepID=A0A327QLD8_9BACT|nr:hypothetical protein LX64_02644 [Chitinophaga skermanii]
MQVLLLLLCSITMKVQAQQANTKTFVPAVATLQHYNALYILNESDDKKIRALLRNIGNALNDPRLKGKLHVEVVVFGDGVEMNKKSNPYAALMLPLKEKGVVFVQCENTLAERKIDKSEVHDFLGFVPSGNGEIILRQYEGWAVIKP